MLTVVFYILYRCAQIRCVLRIQSVEQATQEAQNRFKEMKAKEDAYREQLDSIRSKIHEAESMNESMVSDAHQRASEKAEAILVDAKRRAEDIIRAAQVETADAESNISEMTKQAEGVVAHAKNRAAEIEKTSAERIAQADRSVRVADASLAAIKDEVEKLRAQKISILEEIDSLKKRFA